MICRHSFDFKNSLLHFRTLSMMKERLGLHRGNLERCLFNLQPLLCGIYVKKVSHIEGCLSTLNIITTIIVFDGFLVHLHKLFGFCLLALTNRLLLPFPSAWCLQPNSLSFQVSGGKDQLLIFVGFK